jgi:hypothetical protein
MLTALGTIVLGGIAVYSAYYIPKQLSAVKREERVTRTADYMKRFNDKSFGPDVEKVMVFLRPGLHSEDGKWQEFWGNPDIRHQVFVVLKLFNEIGVIYNEHLVERSIIGRMFALTFPNYYKRVEWFIKRLRELEKRWDLYEDWEKMVRDVEKRY